MSFGREMIAGALLMVSSAGACCFASTITYTAVLSGSQETPPNASMGSGTAMLTLTGDMLTINESFTGLSAPANAAHIHCCTPAGVAAPVVVPFPAFPVTTSGTFSNTFDLSTFAFGGGLTEASFLAGLNSGLAYVNIHDMNFTAGEIRGQLSTVTPEPGSLMLLGTGVIGLAGVVRRRLRL